MLCHRRINEETSIPLLLLVLHIPLHSSRPKTPTPLFQVSTLTHSWMLFTAIAYRSGEN
ncbi:hypothetical protein NC651_021030 [Populus alba x Populus x berolinensis]|nr:hypothetical protein NC651_021030 [Populus alba x Populus x berolinensis]